MKETVNINISGMVFHIDVDAYETLKNYLERIKSFFNNSDEREEIMADIESRIAELFNENINQQKQVINAKDVEKVMEVMGKPEQFAQDDEMDIDTDEAPRSKSTGSRVRKRLFRDPDERILGGVASGIGAYIGIDPVWMRLLFVIGFFGGFIGFFFYIILWIIIPEAKTASDRLRMKGEPVNVENIGKSFKDGANKFNERINEIDTNNWSEKIEYFFTQFFSAMGTMLAGLLRALGKILGVFFFLVGILFAVVLIGGLFGSGYILSVGPFGVLSLDSYDFLVHAFESPAQFTIAKYTLMLIIVIPILALVYGGIKLLFGIRSNAGLGIGFGVLWAVGILVCLGLGLSVATNFNDESEVREFGPIDGTYQDYVIQMNDELSPGEEVIQMDEDELFFSWDKADFHMGYVDFTIEPSRDENMVMEIVKTSNGATMKRSNTNARNIEYSYVQESNLLLLPSYFSFHQEDKLRGQWVKLILRLPVGKIVYLDPSMRNMIDDIDNVTNTWDGDMLGQRWVMLEDGLTCLDCQGIDGISSEELEERILGIEN